jgi:hypothetical protein
MEMWRVCGNLWRNAWRIVEKRPVFVGKCGGLWRSVEEGSGFVN